MSDQRKTFLVAVDDSDASERALGYTARTLRFHDDYRIRLVHILPPLPSEIREMPWVDTPRLAERAKAEFRAARDQWIARSEQAARRVLSHAKHTLTTSGLSASYISDRVLPPHDVREIPSALLDLARAEQDGTIVVGRSSYSGLAEMLHRHIGDQLVSGGTGLAVWLVE